MATVLNQYLAEMILTNKAYRRLLFLVVFMSSSCRWITPDVSKIEMNLSALGVESDDYPSIRVFIDFKTDSNSCKRDYYTSGHNDLTYSLTKAEVEKIKNLVNHANLNALKKGFAVNATDQPTSTIKFYTNDKVITVKDYGLKGNYPLQEMYQIAYKF